jgi:hypothetical protein
MGMGLHIDPLTLSADVLPALSDVEPAGHRPDVAMPPGCSGE